jgi:hypothetical protein
MTRQAGRCGAVGNVRTALGARRPNASSTCRKWGLRQQQAWLAQCQIRGVGRICPRKRAVIRGVSSSGSWDASGHAGRWIALTGGLVPSRCGELLRPGSGLGAEGG